MLSSVCETSVPSTTGSRSRVCPVRRATTNARDGSPRRAGSVADISTPMKVPCRASRSLTATAGSAARRIACQDTARSSIDDAIRASETSTHRGLEASSAPTMLSTPMRATATTAAAAPATAAARQQRAARDRERGAPRARQRRLQRGQPAGRPPRQSVAGQRADAHGGPAHALRRARAPQQACS